MFGSIKAKTTAVCHGVNDIGRLNGGKHIASNIALVV